MSTTTRRAFCVTAAAGVAGWRFAGADSPAVPAAAIDVSALERPRVVRAAERYLREHPVTITAHTSPRSAGGRHDYFSEGDYWWPDPADPKGPYIQRDGLTNPDNFVAHRHALIRLSVQVPALTAAWVLTKQRRYARHAAGHLRAWFLNPATLMLPKLTFAQAIHGRVTGRGIGIIDTLHLVEVARAIPFLEESRVLSDVEHAALKKWFADYLQWMTTSANGIEEREAQNNHGTCWVLQAAQFARYTSNEQLMRDCAEHFRNVLVPTQIAPDGSLPLELKRTKPYSYCLFNLDAMVTTCQVLAGPHDDLWSFRLADGRGVRKATEFMFPYIADKHAWPYAHDVEYFDQFPVRQPSLLFAGLAYSQPDYLALWRTLDPDPAVPEVIRNYPIRQPVLWV